MSSTHSENYITVKDSASLIGCSYPTVINLLNEKKLKGKKEGKDWLVDAVDAQRVKDSNIVRPRKKKQDKSPVHTLETKPNMKVSGDLQADEIEIKFKVKRSEFNLVNMALETRTTKGPKSLREYLEKQKDELLQKIRAQMTGLKI